MVNAGLAVISKHQDHIDNTNIGNKGLDGKTVLTQAQQLFQEATGSDPTARSLGSTCLALVVFLALIGVTAEYLFFGGVSQEFAMLVGLLAAQNLVEARVEQRSATGSLTSHSPA